MPVYFIIYWDGKRLRAYIPTDGNPFNTDTRRAYGNSDRDGHNIRKRFGDGLDIDDLSHHPMLIDQDIRQRLTPGHVSPEHSLQQRITALRFYGTSDESEELFHSLCHLCYQLSGLGLNEWAETVYGWAREHTEASKEDGHDDYITGRWS